MAALCRAPTRENYDAVLRWFCDEGKDAGDKDKTAASQQLKAAWDVFREFQPYPAARWSCCADAASRQSGATSSQVAAVWQEEEPLK